MGRKCIDLTGQRFGRLTVIERVENSKNGEAKWLCECDCGKATTVHSFNLRCGNTRSCGCLITEALNNHNKKHGLSSTRIFSIWRNIKTRCYNPNTKDYSNYGGRGITVCDEWQDSFIAFHDWAIANGYTNDLTIDRIDNNKGYNPANCRWTTKADQNRNQRRNHYIEYNGKRQTLAEWAREFDIPYKTFHIRLSRGWSIERALTTPVKKK